MLFLLKNFAVFLFFVNFVPFFFSHEIKEGQV